MRCSFANGLLVLSLFLAHALCVYCMSSESEWTVDNPNNYDMHDALQTVSTNLEETLATMEKSYYHLLDRGSKLDALSKDAEKLLFEAKKFEEKTKELASSFNVMPYFSCAVPIILALFVVLIFQKFTFLAFVLPAAIVVLSYLDLQLLYECLQYIVTMLVSIINASFDVLPL
jgi:hypothetical protein